MEVAPATSTPALMFAGVLLFGVLQVRFYLRVLEVHC